MILSVPHMDTGTIGHPAFCAILYAPSLKGRSSSPSFCVLQEIPSWNVRIFTILHDSLQSLGLTCQGMYIPCPSYEWKDRNLQDSVLGHKSQRSVQCVVTAQYIKEASVVADKQNRLDPWAPSRPMIQCTWHRI